MTSSSENTDHRVLAFVRDARTYCEFVDRLAKGKPPECYDRLLQMLSNLAVSGLALPCPDVVDEAEQGSELSHDEWWKLGNAIAASISQDVSALVKEHDGNKTDSTPAVMLWDDLADIYRDLKNGLRFFDSGTRGEQLNAIWEWRFGYEIHWGSHLMRALCTVHEIRFFVREG